MFPGESSGNEEHDDMQAMIANGIRAGKSLLFCFGRGRRFRKRSQQWCIDFRASEYIFDIWFLTTLFLYSYLQLVLPSLFLLSTQFFNPLAFRGALFVLNLVVFATLPFLSVLVAGLPRCALLPCCNLSRDFVPKPDSLRAVMSGHPSNPDSGSLVP